MPLEEDFTCELLGGGVLDERLELLLELGVAVEPLELRVDVEVVDLVELLLLLGVADDR